MAERPRGVNIKLSPARRLGIETLYHACKIPSIPVARLCNVAAAAASRLHASPRPSWTALFIRAYGLVAREFPELRRVYLPLPYKRLYEHPHSTCGLIVEREWQGEMILLGVKIRNPEEMPLATIQQHIERFRDAPVREVSDFRLGLRVGRMPGFLRRFFYWETLYWSGPKRAKRLGTFMVSSYGSLGAEQLHPRGPHTSLLTFGPISPEGQVVVKIIYDHRVTDGRRIAHCLRRLEEVLQTRIRDELLALRPARQVA
jgi:pyruvate/2-oxoglutarate dehydrogenase complex dihydrolipoamide acyltransferase (E2) component